MTLTIAHLGPTGTNAETAALILVQRLQRAAELEAMLCPQASNALTLKAVFQQEAQLGVVPVENSIEGSVAMTLDTFWQLDALTILGAMHLPITHALITEAASLAQIETVYSHPQALAQCQDWLAQYLPNVQLIPTNSTTEPLKALSCDRTLAAISAPRAAELYDLKILASPINDRPDNCTRFWIVGADSNLAPSLEAILGLKPKTHTSLAFSLPANRPGALVKALQIFAHREINLSRIESRPTKRSLGDYIFFMDLEASLENLAVQAAITELTSIVETLKIFGSYAILDA
jgi:prephenate dehydratase